MADALQGLVEFTSDMAKAGLFGDGMPPEVRVRPPQAGSVVIEGLLHWTGQHPEAAVSIGMPIAGRAVGCLVVAIRAAFRYLICQPADFDHLENGNVKVNWTDGTAEELPVGVWMELSKTKGRRKRSLHKLMAPLGNDADRLEV